MYRIRSNHEEIDSNIIENISIHYSSENTLIKSKCGKMLISVIDQKNDIKKVPFDDFCTVNNIIDKKTFLLSINNTIYTIQYNIIKQLYKTIIDSIQTDINYNDVIILIDKIHKLSKNIDSHIPLIINGSLHNIQKDLAIIIDQIRIIPY